MKRYHVFFIIALAAFFYLYVTRQELFRGCMPVDTKTYDYTTRIIAGNAWRCPFTWQDTGCNWTHKNAGQYQCRRAKGSPVPLELAIKYTQQVLGKGAIPQPVPKPAPPKPSTPTSIPTNITYYGQTKHDDNGLGFTGIDLFAFDRFRITYGDKRVYPVAVHHDHAHDWVYSVVEVTGPKIAKNFLGYVVDICNRNDSSCSNKDKNGLSFLIDIHKTGFEASGNTNNGRDFTTGYVRKVGYIPVTKLPAGMFPKGDDTYIMCACDAPCTAPVWKSLRALKAGTQKCK